MSTDRASHQDLATIAARRSPEDLAWVEVDSQVVAWTRENDGLHILDPIATLIFQLSDGSVSTRQTVLDLAGAFGAEPSQIEADVLRCVAQLIEDQLLEEVR